MTGSDHSDHTGSIALTEDELGDPLTEAVVLAVAEETGRSPLEMDPLLEVVDPDALDSLFDSTRDRPSALTVTFTYCGQEITVTTE